MEESVGQKHIIYVDDDEEDRAIFSESLEEVHESVALTVFDSGHALIKYLGQLQSPMYYPDSIVCDMKMPLLDGMEVLKIIKQNANWNKIPLIIFSTSSSKNDIDLALKLGARAFISKPSTFQGITNAISSILSLCDDC